MTVWMERLLKSSHMSYVIIIEGVLVLFLLQLVS